MQRTVQVRKLHGQEEPLPQIPNPSDRLDLLERLRLESGKFLYDYPARLRKVVAVVRRKRR